MRFDCIEGGCRRGWEAEKIREGRGLGVMFVFWGVWKGIRNRKGGDAYKIRGVWEGDKESRRGR